MLKLHYAPKTISVVIAIVLEELGTPYASEARDFKTSTQTTPEYLKINAKGRVPALETPQGVLTETPAIVEYVAPSLVPDDPFAAAKMRELISYLNSTMHPHHAHAVRGERWASEQSSFADMKRLIPQRMAECCAHLELFLPTLPYQIGTMQVLSDAYLFVVLTWLEGDGVDIAQYPQLAAFQAEMQTRASVRAVYDKGML